jgi:hypothetical protein
MHKLLRDAFRSRARADAAAAISQRSQVAAAIRDLLSMEHGRLAFIAWLGIYSVRYGASNSPVYQRSVAIGHHPRSFAHRAAQMAGSKRFHLNGQAKR